jgi:hypothetical protein
MAISNLDTVNAIGDAIHTELPERPEVSGEKFRLFPAGCQILMRGTEIVGYGISHPWILNNIPPLDTFLERLPEKPECLFIHDVVVLPIARGYNAAASYIDEMCRIARSIHLKSLALVSVYGTTPLWSRYGFEVVTDPSLNDKLKSYGKTAKYMIRHIDD